MAEELAHSGGQQWADLNEAFGNESLPLPARLDAARTILRLLAEASAAMRDSVTDLVRSASRDPDLTATLYWGYEDVVPGALLGSYHQIRDVIEPRCPWTYPCPGCGADQPVTSRSALKTLRKLSETDSPGWQLTSFLCPTCREARAAAQHESYREREAVYRRRVRELRTMPYRQYLRTPEWQERRRARLKAARYACQVCNTRNIVLNVHHRTYVRRGEEFARDLIVLCETCHHLFHRNGSLAPHAEADQ
jgi:hypothetical protein